MGRILFLVPRMPGPAGDFRLGLGWPDAVSSAAARNRWRVVTPGILVLAAIARQHGYSCDVVDEEFREVDAERQYDIVCIYTVTPNASRSYRYAGQFRAAGSHVVLGGVHACFLPEEAAQYADTLLLGEGEEIFPRFLHDFRRGRALPQYRQPQGCVDLSASPLPAYDLLGGEELKLVPVQTMRGCPRDCAFCNVRPLYGSTVRCKSLEQAARELEQITALNSKARIYLTNDNIMGSLPHFYGLCSLFRDHGATWYANADISFGDDPALVELAYNSGLRQVLVGLESIDTGTLETLDASRFKSGYLGRYRENIARIQSAGIGVSGSFIIGKEDDRAETFDRLAGFIYDTCLYNANITAMTPYPGTRLFEEYRRKGLITTYDWDCYTIFQPIVRGRYLDGEERNRQYIRLLETVNSSAFLSRKSRYFMAVYKGT